MKSTQEMENQLLQRIANRRDRSAFSKVQRYAIMTQQKQMRVIK